MTMTHLRLCRPPTLSWRENAILDALDEAPKYRVKMADGKSTWEGRAATIDWLSARTGMPRSTVWGVGQRLFDYKLVSIKTARLTTTASGRRERVLISGEADA